MREAARVTELARARLRERVARVVARGGVSARGAGSAGLAGNTYTEEVKKQVREKEREQHD